VVAWERTTNWRVLPARPRCALPSGGITPGSFAVLGMTGFWLGMTGFWLGMTGFWLGMTGFWLGMPGFWLRMTSSLSTPEAALHR
jgi:hypothetical protein